MDQDNAVFPNLKHSIVPRSRLGEIQQKHDEIHAKDSQKAVRSGFLQWEFEPWPYKGKIPWSIGGPMNYREIFTPWEFGHAMPCSIRKTFQGTEAFLLSLVVPAPWRQMQKRGQKEDSSWGSHCWWVLMGRFCSVQYDASWTHLRSSWLLTLRIVLKSIVSSEDTSMMALAHVLHEGCSFHVWALSWQRKCVDVWMAVAGNIYTNGQMLHGYISKQPENLGGTSTASFWILRSRKTPSRC